MKRNIVILVFSVMLTIPLSGSSGKEIGFQETIVENIETEDVTTNNLIEVSVIEIDPIISEMDNMKLELEEISGIENKRDWFIAYKKIIEDYSGVIDAPETLYDYYSNEELDKLFSVVQAEIGDNYSFIQKVNVASVIFNRIEHDLFPSEMENILVSDQFSTISNGSYIGVEVSEDTILACEYAFMIEDTTDGCLFFDSNSALKYEFAFNDGAHNFYRLKGDK